LKYLIIGFLSGYLIMSFIIWWSFLITTDLNKISKDQIKSKENLRAPLYQAINPFYQWVNLGWYIFYHKPNP
jgi:p-aminobenzoyl-glutamate transporter AbgT